MTEHGFRLLSVPLGRIALVLAAALFVLTLAHSSWADGDGEDWGYWQQHHHKDWGRYRTGYGYPVYLYAPPPPAYIVVPAPPPRPVYLVPAPIYAPPSISFVFPIQIH